MKAVVLKQFGGTENLALEEIAAPSLTPNAVRVRIKAAAFNPIDYQMRRGGSERKLLQTAVLGREMAGVVAETGDDATAPFAVGERVYAYVSSFSSNGAYAEETVVPAALLARVPANLSFAEAAAIPLVGLTAWQTVERCAIAPDDAVFVAGGAGGVGSMLVRLLKLRGVEKIWTTAGSDESRRRLRAYGLDDAQIFDYRDENLAEHLIGAARGRFDFCLDTVGGSLSEIAARIVKVAGVYADIANLGTGEARELLFDKACTILNIANYAFGLDGDAERLRYYGVSLERLSALLESGALAPTPVEIVGGLSAETVARAHDLMERNATRGRKLVMTVD